MKVEQSIQVKRFISDLFSVDIVMAEIVVELYRLFELHNSDFTDKFIYGGVGIYWGDELIGGIYVSRHHVSLVFSDGNKLDDTYKVLEGTGKYRRHIKIRTLDDINSKHCSAYVDKLFKIYR